MKKKKGFTLIELLAVIVILAIIALIATPIVMNVIENARKGAAERSIENYLRAVDTAIMTEKLNRTVEDGTYEIQDDGSLCIVVQGTTDCEQSQIMVEVSGDKPDSGGIVIIENNKVVQALSTDSDKKTTVSIGDYTVEYNGEGKLVATKKEDGIIINSEEQLYALQRILLTKALRNAKGYTDQTYEDDFELFDIPSVYDTTEKKIEYLRTAVFNLKKDLTVTFTRMDASNQFMAIGTTDYPFSGTFNGNNHTITLSGGTLKLNSNMNGYFGLFGYVDKATISSLNLKVNSDVVVAQINAAIKYGLLSGYMSNSTVKNITLNVSGANVGIKYDNATYRGPSKVGGLIAESKNNNFYNIDVKLENSQLLYNNNSSDNFAYSIGGLIADSEDDNITNIRIDLINSKIASDVNKSESVYVAGIVAEAKFTNIASSNVNMKNSSIGGTLTNGISTSKYTNLSVGGVVGYGNPGSDNTESTVGNIGVTIKNTNVTINNDEQIDSIYAIEKSGGSVNVGGIMALVFNNSEIENCNVNVTNGKIIASRNNISDTTHSKASGVLAGGIVGRMEHTGRMYNSDVVGNNLLIEANGNNINNYAGGIVAIDLGPDHRNVISIENCDFEGNNSSLIKLNLTGTESVAESSIGGISGYSTYISKNNTIKNTTIELNNSNKSDSKVFAGKLFGAFNRNYLWFSSTHFTPENTRGLIDNIINNVTLEVDGNITTSDSANECGYYKEF